MSWRSRGRSSVFTHLLLLETDVTARDASAGHSRGRTSCGRTESRLGEMAPQHTVLKVYQGSQQPQPTKPEVSPRQRSVASLPPR